jgi:2-(1,2-epoxy-1,2-dihydrophenyl)acetyl-CoA isomerase
LILASSSTYYLAPFAIIGPAPDGGLSCLLTARAGAGAFNRLCMTSKRLPAGEAQSLGLIDFVVEHDDLMPEAFALASQLKSVAPESLSAIKKLVNDGPLRLLDEALAREARTQGVLASSPDFARATESFRQQQVRPRH